MGVLSFLVEFMFGMHILRARRVYIIKIGLERASARGETDPALWTIG